MMMMMIMCCDGLMIRFPQKTGGLLNSYTTLLCGFVVMNVCTKCECFMCTGNTPADFVWPPGSISTPELVDTVLDLDFSAPEEFVDLTTFFVSSTVCN